MVPVVEWQLLEDREPCSFFLDVLSTPRSQVAPCGPCRLQEGAICPLVSATQSWPRPGLTNLLCNQLATLLAAPLGLPSVLFSVSRCPPAFHPHVRGLCPLSLQRLPVCSPLACMLSGTPAVHRVQHTELADIRAEEPRPAHVPCVPRYRGWTGRHGAMTVGTESVWCWRSGLREREGDRGAGQEALLFSWTAGSLRLATLQVGSHSAGTPLGQGLCPSATEPQYLKPLGFLNFMVGQK